MPRETYPGERRVSVTPDGVKMLIKDGFKEVVVQSGAGAEAEFSVRGAGGGGRAVGSRCRFGVLGEGAEGEGVMQSGAGAEAEFPVSCGENVNGDGK